MNTVKRSLFYVCFLVIGLILGSCVTTTYGNQEMPLKIWKENENGYMNTWNLVDENTGVNYIVVSTELGNGELSCAITPRLNKDGTLYLSK